MSTCDKRPHPPTASRAARKRWGFSAETIRVLVMVWQGREDRMVLPCCAVE